jgi:hypothetical protein
MHIQTISVVCLHSSEAKRAMELAWWIDPHVRDLYADSKEIESARKLFNSLIGREVRYEEEKAQRTLTLLRDVYSFISKKREEMLALKNTVPAHAPDNAIVLRPKEFVQSVIDNYAFQMQAVAEICDIFEKENDPFDFEE